MLNTIENNTTHKLTKKQLSLLTNKENTEIISVTNDFIFFIQYDINTTNNSFYFIQNMGIISKSKNKIKLFKDSSHLLNFFFTEHLFLFEDIIKSKELLELFDKHFFQETITDFSIISLYKVIISDLNLDFEIENVKKIINNKETLYSITDKVNSIADKNNNIILTNIKGKLVSFNKSFFTIAFGQHFYLINRQTNEIVIPLSEKKSIIELYDNYIVTKTTKQNSRELLNNNLEVLETNIKNIEEIEDLVYVHKNTKLFIYDRKFNLIDTITKVKDFYKTIDNKIVHTSTNKKVFISDIPNQSTILIKDNIRGVTIKENYILTHSLDEKGEFLREIISLKTLHTIIKNKDIENELSKIENNIFYFLMKHNVFFIKNDEIINNENEVVRLKKVLNNVYQ